ncbi:hypothetical protein [Streptomyces sp. HB2AG]|uniref:hypothetical protein n=1 Tax=Streptomyces sp. HB2AG TaxID=2983400 RepID=UPI0022AA9A96|nr:hypothetical protein [Streptomyces sp. HB2AG]MCZ2528128.1 hypothetical protein [Streptomyces sp. HB2AG]
MLDEPRSGRLAAWGNAMFAGLVPPDDAAQKAVGDDTVHRITGLPGEDRPVAVAFGLGRLRALGARGLRVALPAPGHPLGLSGPAPFNERALAAGEAVVAVGGPAVGLVPEVSSAGPAGDRRTEVLWHCLPVRQAPPADVPPLAEAERELTLALREATEVLTRMDVAGAGPGAQAALEGYRARRSRRVLAPGYPARAVRVLELAQRVGALLAIAGVRPGGAGAPGEHGAAVSASQMAARARALAPVERTARRAQVAAYNAYVEELERQGM